MTTDLRIEVVRPGLVTSIQDPGRHGIAFYGFPRSGWLDSSAAQLANRLLGNPVRAPLLECNLLPVGLRFLTEARIALTGADMGWTLDGEGLERNAMHSVDPGQQLGGAPTTNGARAYVAIGGSLRCRRIYGSASTDLASGIGGIGGRRLREGDELRLAPPTAPAPSLPRLRPIDYNAIDEIGLLPGPEWGLMEDASHSGLERGAFNVDSQSNRMGARLNGDRLHIGPTDLPTVPLVPGVVQLPPSGQPIVILQDGQTTGGYPRIGVIPEMELDRFNQLRPGQPFRFKISDE